MVAPWSSLDKNWVGISALSPRLRDLLSRITRQEFPSVVRDISTRLLACEEDLRDLGPSRETPEQQRRYLLGIATRFQEITTFAIEAQYGRHQFLKDDKNLRLATLFVDLNSTFSKDLERKEHAVDFDGIKLSPSKSPRKIKTMRSRKLKLEACLPALFAEQKSVESQDRAIKTIDLLESPELMNVLRTVSKTPPPLSENIIGWIEREYKSSRGFELGTFNPSILPILFQELSTKWENLAGAYVTDIIATIHHFGNTVLRRLCTEERVMNALWSLLMNRLLQRYRKTVNHIYFLLQTERSGNLLTTNHYFSETLDKLRSDRNAEQNSNFLLRLRYRGAKDTRWKSGPYGERHPRHIKVILQGRLEAICRQCLYARNRFPSDHRT